MKRNKDNVPTSMLPKGTTREYDAELKRRVWIYKGKKYLSKRMLIGSLTNNVTVAQERVEDLPEEIVTVKTELSDETINAFGKEKIENLLKAEFSKAIVNSMNDELKKTGE